MQYYPELNPRHKSLDWLAVRQRALQSIVNDGPPEERNDPGLKRELAIVHSELTHRRRQRVLPPKQPLAPVPEPKRPAGTYTRLWEELNQQAA